jgi:hypothetical protein
MLPAGMLLNAATGELNGFPTVSGDIPFTITATDAVGGTASQAYTLTVHPPLITLNPPALPGAAVGGGYMVQLSASGGAAPYTFALLSGTLPQGLTLDAMGLLSGTPREEGVFTFHVLATDSGETPHTGGAAFTLTVDYAPVFVSGPSATPSPAVVNLACAFSATLEPADAVVTWNFGDDSGGETGTPVQHIYSAPGLYTVSVSAKNPRTQTATPAEFMLLVTESHTMPATFPMLTFQGTVTSRATGESIHVTGDFQAERNLDGMVLTFGANALSRTFTFGKNGAAQFADGRARAKRTPVPNLMSVLHIDIWMRGDFRALLATGAALDADGLPRAVLFRFASGGTDFSAAQPLAFVRRGRVSTARFGFGKKSG